MNSTVFWSIRLSIIALATTICFIPIVVTLRLKLDNRLPMLYAIIIAICQSVICISALIFGICSAVLVQDDTFNPENDPAIQILCQFQAALFHSSELISYSLTALLAKIIYDALKGKDIHVYEYKARVACFLVPAILAAVMAGLQYNGLCVVQLQPTDPQDPTKAYFNSGCLKQQHKTIYYLMYVLPSCILSLITVTFIILTRVQRRKLQFSHSNSIDHQLALIVYNIPSYSFVLYIISIIFAAIFSEINSIPRLLAQHTSFLIPVVTMITVLIYKKYYLRYSEDGSLFTTLTP